MSKMLEFESKQEKYVFFSIMAVLLILGGVIMYPIVKTYITDGAMEKNIIDTRAELTAESKSPKEYYAMFQCSCCGQSIDKDCCDMAKQRKAYVDELLLAGLNEDEVTLAMVKKFGFDVLMDQSKEQEVRDYIRSKAPDDPPTIFIDNPNYDLGTVKQSEGIVTTMLDIKNTGKSDLIIDNMDTSCMCTSASLIYKEQEGPKFSMSMHGDNPKGYSLTIPPGETAQLKVYYDPMAHGKQKKAEERIIREVTIISNDPVDFQKKVRIELTQVP